MTESASLPIAVQVLFTVLTILLYVERRRWRHDFRAVNSRTLADTSVDSGLGATSANAIKAGSVFILEYLAP
jgi:hypothetical protein